MAAFVMHPFRLGFHIMPDLQVSHEEAQAVVAYLKWMSAVDANGFPAGFGSGQGR
jgi:nitric oxide reductase subunit C